MAIAREVHSLDTGNGGRSGWGHELPQGGLAHVDHAQVKQIGAESLLCLREGCGLALGAEPNEDVEGVDGILLGCDEARFTDGVQSWRSLSLPSLDTSRESLRHYNIT